MSPIYYNLYYKRGRNWKGISRLVLDSELDFCLYYNETIKRALKLKEFICRNSADLRSVNSFKFLYSSLVKFSLEYISPVCSPFHKVHCENTECVQNKFLRYLAFKLHLSIHSDWDLKPCSHVK